MITNRDVPVTINVMIDHVIECIESEVARTRQDSIGDAPVTISSDAAFGLAVLCDFIHSVPRIYDKNGDTGRMFNLMDMFRQYMSHKLAPGQDLCPDCGRPNSEHVLTDEPNGENTHVKTH